MIETFFMKVGFTHTRPVIPEEYVTYVTYMTDGGINEARTVAAHMVGWRPGVEMVTSVEVVMVEI